MCHSQSVTNLANIVPVVSVCKKKKKALYHLDIK